MDDQQLERLAQEELLQEAKRAQKRAEEMGAVGWQRCPLPATNKRFLHNMLVSTLEPRRKKIRQEDNKEPRNERKHGTRDKTHSKETCCKRTSRHEEKNKHTNKAVRKSAPKCRNKWKTDGSP